MSQIKSSEIATDDYGDVACPLPGCNASLELIRESGRPILAGDLLAGIALDDSTWTCSWRIECHEGHVVLLPGPVGCCEEDPECGHDTDAFDWSDDTRNFRAHDVARLRALIKVMAQVTL